MYRFDEKLITIAAELIRCAKMLETLPHASERTYAYAFYDDEINPAGTLHATVAYGDYGTSITLNAQLWRDPDRANQVTIDKVTTADITFAIGFTCGLAFWRRPR